jgi:hypothetical protein
MTDPPFESDLAEVLSTAGSAQRGNHIRDLMEPAPLLTCMREHFA